MYAQRPKKKVVEQLKEYLRKHQQPTSVKPLDVPKALAHSAVPNQTSTAPRVDYSNVAPQYLTVDMSLKEMMRQITEEQKKALQTAQNPTEQKPLDETRIRELWQRYVRSLDQANMHMAAAMSNMPRIENETVLVDVPTKMLGDTLMSNVDLVNFIRYETGHLGLVIKAVVNGNNSQQQQEIVYTAKQKVDKMQEENHFVTELINKFTLTIEY